MSTVEIWEDRNCCVCGSDQRKELFSRVIDPNVKINELFWGHYGEKGREKFNTSIQECLDCGHIYSSPYLTDQALEYCYSFSDFDNTWDVDRAVLLKTARRYLKPALPFIKDRKTLLDVGCDAGLVLEVGVEAGFSEVLGIEPNQCVAKQAQAFFQNQKQVRVFNDFYQNWKPTESDLTLGLSPGISMLSFIHVMDHLKDPNQILSQAFQQLSPGGVIIAVTHNIHSWLARLSRRGFPPINLQHPHFFHPDTLSRLFEKSGFETLKIVPTVNDYPLFHYVKYAPGLPESWKDGLVKLLSMLGMRKVTLSVPLGNMMIIARKPQ